MRQLAAVQRRSYTGNLPPGVRPRGDPHYGYGEALRSVPGDNRNNANLPLGDIQEISYGTKVIEVQGVLRN